MKILLIGNYRKGVGGISGQMELLCVHLREEGHSADILSTKASIPRRIALFFQLPKLIKKYDLLHIHCCSGWGFLPTIMGIRAAHKVSKHVVLTYHGGGGERFFDKHSKLVRHFLTQTNANIVLSGFLAKVFDKHQIPYQIIPNIIDFDTSHYRERRAIEPNFICTRSHEELYNIPFILKAFHQVQKEIPKATLTLVGDGSQHSALMQMAKELELQNVIFTGRVPNEEIYQYLERADVFVSASMVDNMPVSLLEAMNAGLLVISSNVGGVPYIVEDDRTGLLFESNDSLKLAEKMIWAVKNSQTANSITRQAYNEVNRYKWNNIKEKLYSVYGISA